LKGDISRLTSRNRFLENQHKCDVKQIEAFNKTIAEKQTAIWGLTKENEKQRASVHSLVDRVKQLIAANNDNKHLIDALKEWKAADKIHDDKIDKLVDSLKQDVETQKAATKAAEDKAEIANGKFKDLEHENARLVTLEAQLAERVKSIAEQLRQLEGDFGVTQGQKATLEASLAELTKKEADAHIEIQSLHQKVHDAKEEVKNAMKKVLESKDHAKLHWNILETIRVDGGWLRTNERHDCDELPVSQPITDINNPFN
jgi:chromosome segregation ATPase